MNLSILGLFVCFSLNFEEERFSILFIIYFHCSSIYMCVGLSELTSAQIQLLVLYYCYFGQ